MNRSVLLMYSMYSLSPTRYRACSWAESQLYNAVSGPQVASYCYYSHNSSRSIVIMVFADQAMMKAHTAVSLRPRVYLLAQRMGWC